MNQEFWKNIKIVYSDAAAYFIQWFEQYKNQVNWEKYILPGIEIYDLPVALQSGIMQQFSMSALSEKQYNHNQITRELTEVNLQNVECIFSDLQEAIELRSKLLN